MGVFVNSNKALLIEINTETDFASKNDIFINFVEIVASYALKINNENEIDINKFLETEFEDKKISEYFTDIISKIGENVVLKRLQFLSNDTTPWYNNTKLYRQKKPGDWSQLFDEVKTALIKEFQI